MRPVAHPGRLLCVGVLLTAVSDLQDWCENWERWRDRTKPQTFADRWRNACESDEWLTADDPADDGQRLTFGEVCGALDMDPDRSRERVYASLSPPALAVIWNPERAAEVLRENREAWERRRAAGEVAVSRTVRLSG